jgi:hypothetical protein
MSELQTHADYYSLLRLGEKVAEMCPAEHGSQKWAYGYNFGEIENNTFSQGNSVIIDVEPQGAVEPVLITEDIKLRVRVLQGTGFVIICNVEDEDNTIKVVDMNPETGPIELSKGDAYYYLNHGQDNLVLRDDCTPAFQGHEEIQLTAFNPETDYVDGRTIELPNAFWKQFELLSDRH